MQERNVTTPFGRRRMPLALVKGQLDSGKITTGKAVDKWNVYRDACDARSILGLRDRALAVLNALLSFYPEKELCEDSNLIVFPSNAQLSVRANGIAGSTLRENLAILVDAGLIHRKDSPNGKRYARKRKDGSIDTAFGFSLAPLLARCEELATMAQKVAEERRRLKVIKEQISLCRRDIRKLISAAIEEGAPGDWGAVETQFVAMIARLRTAKSLDELTQSMDELAMLQDEILNILECNWNFDNSGGNDAGIRQHIQNSNTESCNESEPSSREERGADVEIKQRRQREPLKTFPLSLVLRACPEVALYGSGGVVTSWRDLMSAAIVVRSMLGISPSAYQEACEELGPENSAVVVACLLERAGHINSAGGYLRDLTRKASRGEFSLGPMLMALLRANGEAGRSVG